MMNKRIIWFVLFICSCSLPLTEEYQYWEDLSDSMKSETIKNLNIDENVMMFYMHQIRLSDNETSAEILDTLCAQTTDGNKRMFYFHIMNEVVKNADGALAEMLGVYCIKYINENADYALNYFSKHSDISNGYAVLIATELYLNDSSITDFKQHLEHSVKGDHARSFIPVFLDSIEHELNSFKD